MRTRAREEPSTPSPARLAGVESAAGPHGMPARKVSYCPRHGLERGQHMIDGDEDLPEGPDEDAGRRRRRMRVVQFLLPLIAVWGTYKACFKVGKKVVRKFGDDALQHGDDVKRHGDELLPAARRCAAVAGSCGVHVCGLLWEDRCRPRLASRVPAHIWHLRAATLASLHRLSRLQQKSQPTKS